MAKDALTTVGLLGVLIFYTVFLSRLNMYNGDFLHQ